LTAALVATVARTARNFGHCATQTGHGLKRTARYFCAVQGQLRIPVSLSVKMRSSRSRAADALGHRRNFGFPHHRWFARRLLPW
jgi:hypothetical protein